MPAFFEGEAALDRSGVIGRHRDRVGIAEKIGRVQHHDVQSVALDPLPAIEQPAQGADRRLDDNAERRLDRMHAAHLVGDRANPADAGNDVQNLAVAAPAQQCLEKARRLEDAEPNPIHPAVADIEPQRAFALDAGDVIDLEGPSRHVFQPLSETPRRRR